MIDRLASSTLIAVVLAAPLVAHAVPRTKVFALVVGNNESRDEGVAALSFADDDAARYMEFFGTYAEDTVLLAVMDQETQRLHPDLVARALPPTLDQVRRSWAALNAKAAAARAAGERAELFFVYTGHGNVDAQGHGYLNLRDARFQREDLLRDIVGTHSGDALHIVIDACHAWLVVHERGRLEDLVDATRAHLDVPALADHPEVGLVLATSGEAVTHEWTEYRGGVFSHELRTAMLGAADVNGDGIVEYSEVSAFIAAANQQVSDPRGRLDVFVRAPAKDLRQPLVDLGRVAQRRALVVAPGIAGRWTVEDRRGIRYADVHKASDYPLALELMPDRAYWIRTDDTEALITEKASGSIPLAQLRFEPRAQSERGALREAFRQGLFAAPYGEGFYRGYVSSRDLPAVPPAQVSPDALPPGLTTPPTSLDVPRPGASPLPEGALAVCPPAISPVRTLALGAAGGVAIAGTVAWAALGIRSETNHFTWQNSPLPDAVMKERADTQSELANIAGGVALTSAAVALLLWITE